MDLKIQIKTPKGQATRLEKNMRPFLLGTRKFKKKETWVSPEDNCVIWDIETDIKRAMKISRNVNAFDLIMSRVMSDKRIKKMINEKDKAELEDLLKNQTEVEVVKRATQQEIVEANKTWWDSVKSKFTRKKDEAEPINDFGLNSDEIINTIHNPK